MGRLNRERITRLVNHILDHEIWQELAGEYDEATLNHIRKVIGAEIPSSRLGDKAAAPAPTGGGRKAPKGKVGSRVTLFCDGGSRGNPGPAGGGGEILDETGTQLATFSVYFGRATNNVAEYKALIEGIDRIRELGIGSVDIKLDSELLVKQVRGEYKVRSPYLIPLHREVIDRLKGIEFTIKHVPRAENHVADKLAGRAIDDRC